MFPPPWNTLSVESCSDTLVKRRFFSRLLAGACTFFLLLHILIPSLPGEEPSQEEYPVVFQPTPFSVWLDFDALMRPNAKSPGFPIWMESVQVSSALRPEGEISQTIYRIRFRRFAALNRILLFRLYFDDQLGKNPSISAWSETGEQLFESGALGTSIGLPTSESVSIPMESVDYIELEIPGDGKTVRGAFLTSLEKSDTLQAMDFALPAQTLDPFNSPVKTHVPRGDEELYGRLSARLDSAPTILSKGEGSTAGHEFEIEEIPILAVVSFEILNADIQAPPEIILDQQPLGPATLFLPDLSDPAYTGTVQGLVNGMEIHYEGWLQAQCIIPGSAISPGTNHLYIQSPSKTGSVAVRSVALQLKYDSSTFEYDLVPLRP